MGVTMEVAGTEWAIGTGTDSTWSFSCYAKSKSALMLARLSRCDKMYSENSMLSSRCTEVEKKTQKLTLVKSKMS